MAHSKEVLQRFRRPQFIQHGKAVSVGRAGSRLAGSEIEIHLDMHEDKLQAGFKAYGCPATIASADWLAAELTGSSQEAARLDRHAIIRALGLQPARQHCAALAIEAMNHALEGIEK